MSKPGDFSGVYTALVTPFQSDGSLDLAAYERLLHLQLKAKVAGVVPCGTTGESPSLTAEEKKLLIQMALKYFQGTGIKVIAGTGSNNTTDTVEFSKWASDQGVQGVLVVTPYYNKPSQAGLLQHFIKVADGIQCNLILYNVPGRTGVSFTPGTISELAAHPRITAIKEASGNVSFSSEILDSLKLAGQTLEILSGDDINFLPILAIGGVGLVSVASNLIPHVLVEIDSAFESGDIKRAQALHFKYLPLFRDQFIESNPGPIKTALAATGMCSAFCRLPLAPLTSESTQKLSASLVRCGLKGTA